MSKVKALSEKQKRLAEGKAQGMTDLEACKQAGYSARTHSGASTQVARMRENVQFSAYLRTLSEKSETGAVKSAQEIKEQASRMMKTAEAEDDFSGFVQCATLVCKMSGHFAAEQIEHKVTTVKDLILKSRQNGS